MRRPNPGVFEPFVYLIQKPESFRIIGLGGLAVFSVLMLFVAFGYGGFGYGLLGLLLLGLLWLETSLDTCRRCRHYGSWHCLGQGVLVSRIFARRSDTLNEFRFQLHLGVLGLYLFYCLIWLWHVPLLGFLFTVWVPLLLISAQVPNGFSWRALRP